MNEQEQNERNALQILALAAEKYLEAQDELGKNFIGPQVKAAVEILNAANNEKWGNGANPAATEAALPVEDASDAA